MLCPPTMPTSPFSVPLPKSWPKHAKAATLHFISLAHFVLTHVRWFAVVRQSSIAPLDANPTPLHAASRW
jgi:hypothetical protein